MTEELGIFESSYSETLIISNELLGRKYPILKGRIPQLMDDLFHVFHEHAKELQIKDVHINKSFNATKSQSHFYFTSDNPLSKSNIESTISKLIDTYDQCLSEGKDFWTAKGGAYQELEETLFANWNSSSAHKNKPQ